MVRVSEAKIQSQSMGKLFEADVERTRVFSRDVVLGGGELLLWGGKM